jgi:hypothetical protein
MGINGLTQFTTKSALTYARLCPKVENVFGLYNQRYYNMNCGLGICQEKRNTKLSTPTKVMATLSNSLELRYVEFQVWPELLYSHTQSIATLSAQSRTLSLASIFSWVKFDSTSAAPDHGKHSRIGILHETLMWSSTTISNDPRSS